MSLVAVRPDPDRTNFEPGETISVLAKWSLDKAPESLELRAVWTTEGKGTKDWGVERVVIVEDVEAEGERRLTMVLPRQPYSFSGGLVSITWWLELVALPTKESGRCPMEIGPGGKEVILSQKIEEDDKLDEEEDEEDYEDDEDDYDDEEESDLDEKSEDGNYQNRVDDEGDVSFKEADEEEGDDRERSK